MILADDHAAELLLDILERVLHALNGFEVVLAKGRGLFIH